MMRGIRGAICAHENSKEEIYRATQTLLGEMVSRNGLVPDDIVAAFFTMTPDLNADFPAYAARDMGWKGVAMLGAQESLVPGAPQRAIRVLVLARGKEAVRPVYLGRAAAMRSDLAEPGDADLWNGAAAWFGSAAEAGRLGRLLVVGLGLIGGSLAAAARHSGLFSAVVGCDRNPEATGVAVRNGLIDSAASRLQDELQQSDIVVLAVPVSEIVALLKDYRPQFRPGSVVTDVGSTKRAIVEAMGALPKEVDAVGGHPMTGKTQAGAGSAVSDLFRGSRWAVVETARSGPEALERVAELVRSVGAHPLRMTADAHDEMVAATSHLPAAIAVGAVAIATRTAGRLEGTHLLAGPGFVGASRLATGDPVMTAQMLTGNADNLRAVTDEFIAELREISRLASHDPERLTRRIREAGKQRGALLEESSG